MYTLREWRARRLMSIRDLGDQAGVSTKTIVQLEHGRQEPSNRTMQRLSQALGVEPAEVTEFAAAIEARAAAPANS